MSPVRTIKLVMGLGILCNGIFGAAFECQKDTRCQALHSFFQRNGSPLATHAAAFLVAADLHKLDWRLLPGIAMVESSGGKYCKRNNIFGWNSGRTGFKTIPAGIHHVASRFAASPLYRGRTARGILAAYNPAKVQYPPKVLAVMLALAADPVD